MKRARKKAIRGKVTNGHTRKHRIPVIARKTYRMFATPNSLAHPPLSTEALFRSSQLELPAQDEPGIWPGNNF